MIRLAWRIVYASQWLLAYCYSQLPGTVQSGQATSASDGTWMGDRIDVNFC